LASDYESHPGPAKTQGWGKGGLVMIITASQKPCLLLGRACQIGQTQREERENEAFTLIRFITYHGY